MPRHLFTIWCVKIIWKFGWRKDTRIWVWRNISMTRSLKDSLKGSHVLRIHGWDGFLPCWKAQDIFTYFWVALDLNDQVMIFLFLCLVGMHVKHSFIIIYQHVSHNLCRHYRSLLHIWAGVCVLLVCLHISTPKPRRIQVLSWIYTSTRLFALCHNFSPFRSFKYWIDRQNPEFIYSFIPRCE